MNRVILMGRLTKDPEIRCVDSEKSVSLARFTLAVNRRFKKEGDAQMADFISCVAFRKTAEFIEKYCNQGTKLVVDGRISTSTYLDKDGKKVFSTIIIVENCEFAESKAAADSRSNGNNNNFSNNNSDTSIDADGFMNIPDDVSDEGLPFG